MASNLIMRATYHYRCLYAKYPIVRLRDFTKTVRLKYTADTLRSSFVWLMLCGYNYQLSTRSNYGSTVDCNDSSEFADIRALIDSNHHGYYNTSRQLWQDRVLRSIFRKSQGSPGHILPWVIFTCGSMGSGKTFVRNWCEKNNLLIDWDQLVIVDSDYIKETMPEWSGYVERNPRNAGSLCHEESVYMQEIGHEYAMSRSLDVCIDGSLSDWQWNSKLFKRIRAKYPRYRIAIIAVHVDESIARRRCGQRFLSIGRDIPDRAFLRSLAAISTSLEILGPLADAVIHISNNVAGEDPVLLRSDMNVQG